MSNNCGKMCPDISCITYTSSTGNISFKCQDNDDNKNIILIIVSISSFLLIVTGIIVAVIKFRKRQRVFSTINNKIIFDNKDLESDVVEVKKANKDLSDNQNLNEKQIFSVPDYDKEADNVIEKIKKPEDIVKNLIKYDLKQSRAVSESLIVEANKQDCEGDENLGSRIYLEASPGLVASPYRKRRSKFTYSKIKNNFKDGTSFENN
jgi:hypothetical protein